MTGNCTCPQCGDGRVLWQAKEQCDDGNADENDGCSPACKIENLQLCHGSQSDQAVTPQFVGLPITSYSVKDECFRFGRYWTSYGNATWPARYGLGSVIHMDAIWVVGGIGTGMKQLYNDVWFEDTNGAGCVASEFGKHCSENNGQNWVQARPSQVASHSDYKNESIDNYKAMRTFPPRGFHGLVNHKGFIWVLGGATRKDWHKEAPSDNPRFDTAFNGQFDPFAVSLVVSRRRARHSSPEWVHTCSFDANSDSAMPQMCGRLRLRQHHGRIFSYNGPTSTR